MLYKCFISLRLSRQSTRKRKNARSYSSSHSVPTNSWQQAASIKDTLDCYYSLRNCVFFSTSTLKPVGLSFLPDSQKPSNCSGKSQGEGEQDGSQGRQGGEASVISCLLYTFLLSYLCASTFFSDSLQFSIIAEKNHIWKNFTIITRGSVQKRWASLGSEVENGVAYTYPHFLCSSHFEELRGTLV